MPDSCASAFPVSRLPSVAHGGFERGDGAARSEREHDGRGDEHKPALRRHNDDRRIDERRYEVEQQGDEARRQRLAGAEGRCHRDDRQVERGRPELGVPDELDGGCDVHERQQETGHRHIATDERRDLSRPAGHGEQDRQEHQDHNDPVECIHRSGSLTQPEAHARSEFCTPGCTCRWF